MAFGVAAGTFCNWATQIKFIFGWDDTLDVCVGVALVLQCNLIIYVQIFASHAIGGLVGNLLTGLLAQKSVAGFDGITVIKGGWLDRNWVQLGFQAANSAAGMGYSFVVTVRNLTSNVAKWTDSLHQTLILWVMHCVPFLRLRCSEETEIIGVDDGEMGEFAYDYVGLEIELGPRHVYSGDVGATGGGREPSHMHHEPKNSITSEFEQRSEGDSQYPLNTFAMKALHT